MIALFSSLSRRAIAWPLIRSRLVDARCRSAAILSGLSPPRLLRGRLRGARRPDPARPDRRAPTKEFNDPFEETNRAIFGFNQAVDEVVLVPVAKAYRTVVPPPMRASIHDFLQNLNGPVIFANDVLQGELGLAAKTLARLAINTTVGVGGMFDVATPVVGIPHHSQRPGDHLRDLGH